jgi:hypothetical protein
MLAISMKNVVWDVYFDSSYKKLLEEFDKTFIKKAKGKSYMISFDNASGAEHFATGLLKKKYGKRWVNYQSAIDCLVIILPRRI